MAGLGRSVEDYLARRNICVTWEIVSPWFAPDGALRDICVRGTSRSDWQALVEAIGAWGYHTQWAVGGVDVHPPTSADEAFAARERAGVLLRIDVGPVGLHCHFFSEDEIELDLDPADVRDQIAFDAVLEFLARLGDLVVKPVHLIMEGYPDAMIVTYSPRTQTFDYHAPRN